MNPLSVYETALACLKAEGQIVEDLAGRPLERAAGTTSFTGGVQELLAWCRRGERLVVSQDLRDACVMAGFERLSRTRPAAARYERLCAVARVVWVVGQPDAEVTFPAHRVVPIDAGPLLREWFLLIEAKRFHGMLVARDLDGLEGSKPPGERRFEGVTTHVPGVIAQVAEKLGEAFA